MTQEKQRTAAGLAVKNLTVAYGSRTVLDNVAFTLPAGASLAIVGESGCGKTTTGRSIIKLYNITGGNIYFKGIRIGAGLYDLRQAIKEAKKKPDGGAEVAALTAGTSVKFTFAGHVCHVFNKETGINLEA